MRRPRTRTVVVGLVAAALPLVPALAAAAVATGRSPVYDLAMKFVNFAILGAILYFALRKTVAQGLVDRRENIRRALEEARLAKAAAEAKYQEYKQKVANLDAETRRLQEDFRAEGERQRERILAEARQAADGVARQAELATANELKRAKDELRAEAATLALTLAEELLAKAYTAEDQQKAVDLTIQSVERVH